jgi:hypothetical protein
LKGRQWRYVTGVEVKATQRHLVLAARKGDGGAVEGERETA